MKTPQVLCHIQWQSMIDMIDNVCKMNIIPVDGQCITTGNINLTTCNIPVNISKSLIVERPLSICMYVTLYEGILLQDYKVYSSENSQ